MYFYLIYRVFKKAYAIARGKIPDIKMTFSASFRLYRVLKGFIVILVYTNFFKTTVETGFKFEVNILLLKELDPANELYLLLSVMQAVYCLFYEIKKNWNKSKI